MGESNDGGGGNAATSGHQEPRHVGQADNPQLLPGASQTGKYPHVMIAYTVGGRLRAKAYKRRNKSLRIYAPLYALFPPCFGTVHFKFYFFFFFRRREEVIRIWCLL